jgi:hypothetical protein
MSLSRLAVVAVVAWGLHAGSLHAQTSQPAAGQPVSFDYYYYQATAQPSPSDQPVAPVVQAPTASCACEPVTCNSACCESDCCDCCNHWLEDFSLMNWFGIDPECSPWEIGGWTQMGYHDNNQPLSQAYNDLLSFNDVPDHLHLQQQWFYLGRKVDGSCGFDLGGRIDVVYGTDAQKTQAFGNPGAGVRGFGTFDASLDHGEYGFAIPQLYGEVAYGDWSVKVGHFFTPLGYEVIPATGNFFYSHSYTMYNSEPFTHTGVLATYSGYENLTLVGGWTLGWDTGFDQLNSGNLLLTGFTAKLADDISLAYYSTYGNFGWRDGGNAGDPSYSHSIVLSIQMTCNLLYVLQSDMIDTDNPGISQFDTVGANNYLIYKYSDTLGFGSRFEWWKADGVSFYEATGGVNINLLDNLVMRPEFRHDWAPGIGLDEDTAGVDIILKY